MTEASPRPRTFHFGIAVSDIAASTTFYSECLGFQPLDFHICGAECDVPTGLTDTRFTAQFMSRDSLVIELLCFENPPHFGDRGRRPMNMLGFTHLSLSVPDVAPILAKVERFGGTILRDTEMVMMGRHAIYCLDPDGTSVQLSESATPPASAPS